MIASHLTAGSLRPILAAPVAALLFLVQAPAFPLLAAETLPSPESAPVLVIDGAIANTTDGDLALFDMAALRALPAESFTTGTLWTEGTSTFTGVPLRALLDHVGAEGGTVVARALNEYSVEIPVDEIGETYPVVAYLIDGEEFPVRRKGPLWIVYPYDADPAHRSDASYARSVWQLHRLTVQDD
ncbi:molybdopterin-dependent oxidoreductase [Plastorhodobacter daqingensis]|uniref:Molybdopterin-dependent oxidoreductase n=1 Tax=Plastorhodobacter daqingensis TaxID=1387281 RepID=A0ABW2UK72_9RHOB